MEDTAPVLDESELRIDSLPLLPPAARYLTIAFNRKDLDIELLAEKIRLDPGLSAKLISLANSAQYRDHRDTLNVNDAVVRLGLDETKRVVLSIALRGVMDIKKCPHFSFDWFWFQALMMSFIGQKIAERLAEKHHPAREVVEGLSTVGLMHNIGLLLLSYLFPSEMNLAWAQLVGPKERGRIDRLVNDVVGIDAYAAGATLLRSWELPEALWQSVEALPNKTYAGPALEMVNWLRLGLNWLEHDFRHIDPPAPLSGNDWAVISRLCREYVAKAETISAMLWQPPERH